MSKNLIKLKRHLYILYQNNTENIRLDGKILEIIAVLYLEHKINLNGLDNLVYLWEDVSIECKNDLMLPTADVGVDYVMFQNNNPALFGQTKDYSNGYVNAHSIDRTRLCYYHGNDYYEKVHGIRPITSIEFTTPVGIKMSNPKIKLDNFIVQTIITDDWIKHFIQLALNTVVPEIDNPDLDHYITAKLCTNQVDKTEIKIIKLDTSVKQENMSIPDSIKNLNLKNLNLDAIVKQENKSKVDLSMVNLNNQDMSNLNLPGSKLNINLSEMYRKLNDMNLDNSTLNSTNSKVNYELRRCQKEALAKINPSGITRIKMCCGSGKSLIIIEYMRNNPGTYLILVPYLILQDQWNSILIEYGFKTVLIGTNNQRNTETNFMNKVTICVYNSIESIEDIEYNMIVVDEAHHIKEDESSDFMECIKTKIKETPSILLSATLLKYDYNYTIRDGINDGVILDYDINIPFFEQLDNREDSNNKETNVDVNIDLHTLADYIKNNTKYLSILAYCKRIEKAKDFAEICRSKGITATALSHENTYKERKQVIFGKVSIGF